MRILVVLLLLQFSRSVFASEPLFSAIAQHQESAALELVAKSDVQARDANGDTALHRAVETAMPRLVRSLLAAGADPQARTRNGETALHLAALHPERTSPSCCSRRKPIRGRRTPTANLRCTGRR